MITRLLAGLVLASAFFVGCAATPESAPPPREFKGTPFPAESVKAELRAAAEQVEKNPVFREFGRFKIGAEAIKSETDQKVVMTGKVVAVGTSNMVVIARADRVEFNKETEELVLTGSPEMMHGTSLHVSKSPEGVMTLSGDLSLKSSEGRTTTRWVTRSKSDQGSD